MEDIEGEFVEVPENGGADDLSGSASRRPRDTRGIIVKILQWLRRNRKAVAISAAVVGVIAVVAQLNLVVPAIGVLLWAWFGLLGAGVLVGIVQWIARAESRKQVREFARLSWREVLLALLLSVIVGEVARADEVSAAAFIAGIAFLFIYPAVETVVDRVAFGRSFHALHPTWFLSALVVIYLVGPQFRREMPTDYCDPPNSWVVSDYEENDYGGGHAIYSCYDADADKYVAPRVDGRSLFALRLSNIALRLYSANFTDGRFEGVGICVQDEDCFP